MSILRKMLGTLERLTVLAARRRGPLPGMLLLLDTRLFPEGQ